MGRSPREDWPGAWHHVVNRGLARRTVFENRADVETFLEFLGYASAAGHLEIHAYSILTTHFHLLVRSPTGRLSEGMREVENRYVRGFNRGRRRDGPLFRSRFTSRSIGNEPYWRSVLRYIDRNPVAAGLCTRSSDYPYGSAWWYCRGGGPACLTRSMIETMLADDAGRAVFESSLYPVQERAGRHDWVASVVERRMHAPGTHRRMALEDPFGDLVRVGSAEVQAWMIRKARLADGTEPGWVLVSPQGIDEALAGWPLDDECHPRTAMLRLHAGLTLEEVAAACACSTGTVRARLRRFRASMLSDDAFGRRVAEALRLALSREAGSWLGGAVIRHRVPFVKGPVEPPCEPAAYPLRSRPVSHPQDSRVSPG